MNIVPFGLVTTVSTFQNLMLTVLTGLNSFAFTYLDDVLVFLETYNDHLHHLNTVFEKFQKASLKIKLSKYQFFKTHLHYLGHRISANGLEPLPEKLEAIKNLAPTRNVDEACHILGLLGYYQSFIPAFADITLPITSLLKKDTPFVWSDKCQLALEYLKDIFCNKPWYNFWTTINHMYCIWMLPIMHIWVCFANQFIITMILGRLNIFQAPSQHKTGVGVQLKKKLMLY